MSKFGLFAKKRPSDVVVSKQWRAYDDGPINLSAKPTFDSDTGQKAFVLAFAAVAVAGAAYFATVMLAPNSDPSLVAVANARPAEETAAPATVAVPAAATPSAAPAPVEVAKVEPPAQPELLSPSKVKTVTIPAVKPVEARVAAVPAPQPATTEKAALAPVAPPSASAYAAIDDSVNAGIAAVMGVAIKEGVGERKAQWNDVQVAEVAQADEEPEMAGGKGRRTRSAVTMRSGPQKGAPAIGTIPGNTTVSVAAGCKSWCQVTYNGKSGFIYQGYLQ